MSNKAVVRIKQWDPVGDSRAYRPDNRVSVYRVHVEVDNWIDAT